MKKILLTITLMSSFSLYASTVARVLNVQGNAFSFSQGGKTAELSYGAKIEEMSTVMVEDGSHVSVKDEYGRVFHIAGGSQVKFFNKIVELVKGNIWVSSTVPGQIATITSPNAIAKYTQGQFIFSFDSANEKSQALVLAGNLDLSNTLEPNLMVDVPAGHFSFVDNGHENGLPRSATRVGLTSYKAMKGIFAGYEMIPTNSFDKMFNEEGGSNRSIASVQIPDSLPTPATPSKGKIIFVETIQKTRLPASASPMEYYQGIKAKVKKESQPLKTGKIATVNMWGFDGEVPAQTAKVSAPEMVKKPVVVHIEAKPIEIDTKMPAQAPVKRIPASVGPSNIVNDIQNTSVFEKSLDKSYQENKRHSEERNELIDELKSYNQVYDKNY